MYRMKGDMADGATVLAVMKIISKLKPAINVLGIFAKLQQAGLVTGESFSRLPIDDEYARGIKESLVADLNETGGDASASIGAKFIQQFTDGKPWIHLDIAGTSWPGYTPPYRDAGPTGVTVRTLAELALQMGRGIPHATQ